MVTNNWLPYYVLYMQQQQRAKKAEEEKKKAEEEAQRAREEAEQAQQQTEQKVDEQPAEEPKTEQPITEEPKVEQPAEEPKTTTVETKPAETAAPTTTVSKYKPKSTDCELLYEIGSTDYATCDYARAQNMQANSNIAMMLMFCVAAGIGIAALIVMKVNHDVDKEYRDGRGGKYTLM